MALEAQSWKDVRAKAGLDPAKVRQARQRELDAQRAFRRTRVRDLLTGAQQALWRSAIRRIRS
ncbi:hypothetical protein SAMN04244553_2705 [Nocardia amikacinitolerans]|uniref:Uncharacterized protein n=1 Tax=Nocardia amikacinitolerans TaxID=756689 RepID=A0A285L8B4_9NOCA|nr:hypothetical protein [Nocardia amikacinitolerans]MCP2295928.1 hypothetical protein [Nocardia amikacinitolerans]SNY81122.1 hypothetical protein SAMN04244553_2705 [Nocardia amikacinitolerans]